MPLPSSTPFFTSPFEVASCWHSNTKPADSDVSTSPDHQWPDRVDRAMPQVGDDVILLILKLMACTITYTQNQIIFAQEKLNHPLNILGKKRSSVKQEFHQQAMARGTGVCHELSITVGMTANKLPEQLGQVVTQN